MSSQILCKQGSINNTLYVLQEGVLTSFVVDANNRRRRLHKMTRGAFVNDECLFLDLPVAFSVIANQQCVLWAISRASMKQMEAHDPHLVCAVRVSGLFNLLFCISRDPVCGRQWKSCERFSDTRQPFVHDWNVRSKRCRMRSVLVLCGAYSIFYFRGMFQHSLCSESDH